MEQPKLSSAMQEALKEYARKCYLEKIDRIRVEIVDRREEVVRLQKRLTAMVDAGPPGMGELPFDLEADGKWHTHAGCSFDNSLAAMKILAKHSGEEVIVVFNNREYRSSMTDDEISTIFHSNG